MPTEKTIFEKIIDGEIPCEKVYEDDEVLAFYDIAPVAPTHILVIPKKHIPKLDDASDNDALILGKLLVAAKNIAKKQNLIDFRIVINNGEGACQSVFHLHMHVIAGRPLEWPPG